MPEKNEQEAHRHAWPPEAITCYRPKHFVLKEQEARRDTLKSSTGLAARTRGMPTDIV